MLLLPILAQAFSLSAGDMSTARVRADDLGTHIDVSNAARISLSLDLKRSQWTLTYSPAITRLNLGEADSSTVLVNSGDLSARLRLTPRTTATWSESGVYGRQNMRLLAAGQLIPNAPASTASPNAGSAAPATGSPNVSPAGTGTLALAAPSDAIVTFGRLQTSLSLNHVLDRTWSTTLAGYYTVGGQLDSNTVATSGQTTALYFPRMQTYAGSAMLAKILTPRDSGSIVTNFSHTDVEPSSEAIVATVLGSWLHGFSRSTRMDLSLGASYTRATVAGRAPQASPLPYAQASLANTRSLVRGKLTLFATTSLKPIVDTYGGVYESFGNAVGANWRKRRVSVTFTGYGSNNIGSVGQTALSANYGVSEVVDYQLDKSARWTASAGSFQTFQSYTTGSQQVIVWSGFVSIAYNTALLRF